jgi:hypothetical protein
MSNTSATTMAASSYGSCRAKRLFLDNRPDPHPHELLLAVPAEPTPD